MRLKPTRQYEDRSKISKEKMLIIAHCFICNKEVRINLDTLIKPKDTFYEGYCTKCEDIVNFKIEKVI